jgi:threonine synthase
VVEIRGSFDDALRLCRELAAQPGYVLVNSLNPDRVEGQKSVVFEILEQLGSAPAVIALPFGGGGNVSAV